MDKFFDTVIETPDCFRVKRLKTICYKSLSRDIYQVCYGAVSFIRSQEYDDYCQVFYNEFVETGNDIEPLQIRFIPAYTKEGERIFVKHNRDELRLSFMMKGDFNKI